MIIPSISDIYLYICSLLRMLIAGLWAKIEIIVAYLYLF